MNAVTIHGTGGTICAERTAIVKAVVRLFSSTSLLQSLVDPSHTERRHPFLRRSRGEYVRLLRL